MRSSINNDYDLIMTQSQTFFVFFQTQIDKLIYKSEEFTSFGTYSYIPSWIITFIKYSLRMKLKEEAKIDDIAQDHVHSLINRFFGL